MSTSTKVTLKTIVDQMSRSPVCGVAAACYGPIQHEEEKIFIPYAISASIYEPRRGANSIRYSQQALYVAFVDENAYPPEVCELINKFKQEVDIDRNEEYFTLQAHYSFIVTPRPLDYILDELCGRLSSDTIVSIVSYHNYFKPTLSRLCERIYVDTFPIIDPQLIYLARLLNIDDDTIMKKTLDELYEYVNPMRTTVSGYTLKNICSFYGISVDDENTCIQRASYAVHTALFVTGLKQKSRDWYNWRKI